MVFYSESSLSVKGPLGSIWVAAHLHKKLKKSQVLQINIPSAIDNIIKDPIEVPIALRIAGHLLLGVVRIYSKKVGYLHDDCNETLTKLTTSWGATGDIFSVSANALPVHAMTLPDGFELDALDLERLGYSTKDSSNQHVKSSEQITLEDEVELHWNFDSFLGYEVGEAMWHSIPEGNFLMEDEIFPPYPMDLEFAMDELDDGYNEAPTGKLQEDRMYEEILEPVVLEEVIKQLDAERQSRIFEGTDVPPGLMALPTPKKQEHDWKSRKRKLPSKKPGAKALLIDGNIILPNEVLRNRLRDTSGIVRNRKTISLSVLDVKGLSRISSVQQMFLEPWIPYMSLNLGELLMKSLVDHKIKVHVAKPAAVHGATRMLEGTPIDEVHFASLFDQKQPQKPANKRLRPRQLIVSDDEPDSVLLEAPVTSITNEACHCRSPGFSLSLLDEALNLVAEEAESRSDIGGDRNCSIRTRLVARFLWDACKNPKFQNQDKGLKVVQVLEAKTRKECARLFMEILVLKTQGYIHVEQDSPYADIQLTPLPKLDRL